MASNKESRFRASVDVYEIMRFYSFQGYAPIPPQYSAHALLICLLRIDSFPTSAPRHWPTSPAAKYNIVKIDLIIVHFESLK